MITIHSRKGEFTYPTDYLQKAADKLNLPVEFDLYCEDICTPDKPHWALDNYRLQGTMCTQASHIFYTQPSLGEHFAKLIGRNKIQLVTYGIDPEVHKPHKVGKKYDVGFIGNVMDNDGRAPWLEMINKNFNCFISTTTPTEEIPLRLSECKVLFNHIRYEEVTIRFFEALAVGVQVCSHTPALSMFADLGRDYLSFRTEEECIDKIKFLLEHDDVREQMDRSAQETALRHTYENRLLTMLHSCNLL